MNATLAPARMHLITSRELWTPPVIPRSALTCPQRIAVQCRRRSNSSGRLKVQAGRDFHVFDIEIGLVEAVEEHNCVGASFVEAHAHICRGAEKRRKLHRERNANAALQVADQVDISLVPLRCRLSRDRWQWNRCSAQSRPHRPLPSAAHTATIRRSKRHSGWR